MAQHTLIEGKTYNERLFSPGIRGFFHNGRFKWLLSSFAKLKIEKGSILEIGCNDGRSLDYMPFFPEKYAGYDADWEGGLDEAIEKYKDHQHIRFYKSNEPSTFNQKNEMFDISLAMETLEHLPGRMLDDYLSKLAAGTTKYGFFSVPNEKGIVFFLKYFAKKIFVSQNEPYKPGEIFYATFGNLEKVTRVDTGHKGFDYRKLVKKLSEHFTIIEVKGIPFGFLPPQLNFTVGIIVSKKNG